MEAFIYVFAKKDRDMLLSLGFSMLKADEDADIYIFINDERRMRYTDNAEFVLSNILTF